eukprot:TRINITY_DN18894_c1_g3_i1.p1 TRINITY_DN18894_c1_g3~~TRINITY_DN18894_c1_g3_i1.p1  ORF type:complete len:373 (-),score=27.26 TRINITY_DN18894_c1_g3_i1:287-1405(-)
MCCGSGKPCTKPWLAVTVSSLLLLLLALTLFQYKEVFGIDGLILQASMKASSHVAQEPSSTRPPLLTPLQTGKFTVHRAPATSESHHASTIVTAYFRVKSKASPETYNNWMKNSLSIQDPMVIFTSEDMVENIRALRADHANKTVIVEMSLDDVPFAKLRGRNKDMNSSEFWQDQLMKDPEMKLHKSYKLFWIWLSKSWWVLQTIEQFNFFQSKFFVWSDIGCFRNAKYNGQLVIRHPAVVPQGTIMWMAHRQPNPPPSGPIFADKLGQKQYFYHSGSMAAGTVTSWKHFCTQFAKTVDDFLDAGVTIVDDQCVLQAACLQAPRLCTYVPFNQVGDNKYFGVRYVLRYGPHSAKKTANGEYNFWRPPGWDRE